MYGDVVKDRFLIIHIDELYGRGVHSARPNIFGVVDQARVDFIKKDWCRCHWDSFFFSFYIRSHRREERARRHHQIIGSIWRPSAALWTGGKLNPFASDFGLCSLGLPDATAKLPKRWNWNLQGNGCPSTSEQLENAGALGKVVSIVYAPILWQDGSVADQDPSAWQSRNSTPTRR